MLKKPIISLLVTALALFLAEKIIPGIKITDFWVALWAAFILGVLNYTIKPIVSILALPITFITLGLFTFVINGMFFLLASKIIDGFYVSGLLAAILGSIVTSLISSVINTLIR